MKLLASIFLLAALLFSCGDPAAELREKSNKLLADPAMSEYYQQAYIDGLRTNMDICKDDVDCLQLNYDIILDKLATAQAEIMLKKAMEK